MGTHPIFESDFDCLTEGDMDSFDHSDLDPVSLKIMNVFNRDDLPKLRKENQMLRNKLRQFRESDNKKTQDLKTKNDDISALQKELSNTRHRYHDQHSDRTQEIAQLKAQLDEQRVELARLNKLIDGEDRDSHDYQQSLEINRKGLMFLREELRDVKVKLMTAEEKNVEFDEYKITHTITSSLRRQAEMEIAHGESFRHDAQRVKSLEKELDRSHATNLALRKQAKDKAVAIENEKLWRDRVNRMTPKCDRLEAENERLNGELGLVNTKLKRLEIELSQMRANECKQTEIIGQCRADIGVERSRHQAAMSEINELKVQLEEKQADIALTQTAMQGNVDISAMRDLIKQLELDLEAKKDQLDEVKCRGHLQAGRQLHSYRFNPTFSRKKASDIEIERLKRENTELKRLQTANNSSEVNQVELDELKQKLSDETKTREKLLQVTRTKIQTYREVVSQVLGYDVRSSDGSTYKFLSIYAQERSDAVAFTKDENGLSMHPASLFDKPEMAALETAQDSPLLMALLTHELASQQTLML